jgi:hypothetical protein
MNLSDLKSSKFLKRDDVGQGALVTIRSLSQMNVAKEGADPEMKTVLHFDELDKPLVLNSTNGQIIAQITRCENDIERGWIGHKVVLYDDPNVSFSGKLVGGIRIRAPRVAKPAPAPVPAPSLPDNSDGLPF